MPVRRARSADTSMPRGRQLFACGRRPRPSSSPTPASSPRDQPSGPSRCSAVDRGGEHPPLVTRCHRGGRAAPPDVPPAAPARQARGVQPPDLTAGRRTAQHEQGDDQPRAAVGSGSRPARLPASAPAGSGMMPIRRPAAPVGGPASVSAAVARLGPRLGPRLGLRLGLPRLGAARLGRTGLGGARLAPTGLGRTGLRAGLGRTGLPGTGLARHLCRPPWACGPGVRGPASGRGHGCGPPGRSGPTGFTGTGVGGCEGDAVAPGLAVALAGEGAR